MATYTSQVAAIHKKYKAKLKKAKNPRSALAAYRRHKTDHARLLKKHLREEKAAVNKIRKRLARG